VTNHLGNNFTIFSVDGDSGRLMQHGPSIELEAPYCPRFVPVRN
jgi:6-phosphogluconolactonase (cycloisomerase 2 family)